MIKWKATKEEHSTMGKICDRLRPIYGRFNRVDLLMDLEATHSNGCPLDFERLLAFDKFSFLHDIIGIINNLNRTTGKLGNCFLPRCSR